MDNPDIPATAVSGRNGTKSGQPLPRPTSALVFGIPADRTHPPLQTDAYKELVNKLAWALGSSYRVSYSSRRSPLVKYAQRIANKVFKDHGYPLSIAKPE